MLPSLPPSHSRQCWLRVTSFVPLTHPCPSTLEQLVVVQLPLASTFTVWVCPIVEGRDILRHTFPKLR